MLADLPRQQREKTNKHAFILSPEENIKEQAEADI
jgi:hypothetical protein